MAFPDVVSLLGGAVMELLHLLTSFLATPGENLRSGFAGSDDGVALDIVTLP